MKEPVRQADQHHQCVAGDFIVLRFGELIYRDKLSLAFAGDFYRDVLD